MNGELNVAQVAVEKSSYDFGVYDAFVIVLFIAVSVLFIVNALIPLSMSLHKKDHDWNERPIPKTISAISQIVVCLTTISCIVYALIAADKTVFFVSSVIFLPAALAIIFFSALYLVSVFICSFIYLFVYEPIKSLVSMFKK